MHTPAVPPLARLRPRRHTMYVSSGRTVMASNAEGWLDGEPDQGLFVHETRVLSHYSCSIDGGRPFSAGLSNIDQHRCIGYFILTPPGIPDVEVDYGSGLLDHSTQQTLELRLTRHVTDGVHEDLQLTNYTQHTTAFRFGVSLDADFVDQAETRRTRRQQGRLSRQWIEQGEGLGELRFDYAAEHEYDNQGERGRTRIQRGLIVRVDQADSSPRHEEDGFSFDVTLGPQGTWRACLLLIPTLEGRVMGPVMSCRGAGPDPFELRRTRFLTDSATFETPTTRTHAHLVTTTLSRAREDLVALRLYDLEHDDDAWIPAAGLPLYIALFGRDSLTAGWQAALLSPDLLRGTLPELARWQGREINAWRDEQPGRLLHEAHTGPLAALNINPRGRYYGSVTTSGFFPVALAEYWHWTGDKDGVERLVPHALAALDWLDRYADLDGDGLYEYQTASKDGVRNQAWKDSGDAMVYEDGSQVPTPIGTCEEQAFVYIAKQHLSEVLWWLDRKHDARRLWQEAAALKKQFNEAFWMEDLQFIAMGLGPNRQPIRSISSNPGHCLAAGIVDERYVKLVADRLMAPDLFSGWGIRTLSDQHPAYNPYSYHRGSVWPVEQGSFAIGFVRYGLHDHLQRLCRAQFEAAALFDHCRMPELFAGHPRSDDHPVPGLYPQANCPQAWSASAVFCLIQALLGLYPYAPLRLLIVDPWLPDWLPDLTLRNLRVGDALVSLRFSRDNATGETDYEVLEKSGAVHIVRQPSPWSLTAGLGERFMDALGSLRPH